MTAIFRGVFLLAFILNGLLANAQTDGWESLFNGKDLTGWKQLNGDARFEVKDGVIIGTTVLNTPNSFICTEKNYSDFIFEVEFN